MLHAGRVMARTAELLLEKPELIKQARAELDRRLDGDKYKSLIPNDIKPHYFD